MSVRKLNAALTQSLLDDNKISLTEMEHLLEFKPIIEPDKSPQKYPLGTFLRKGEKVRLEELLEQNDAKEKLQNFLESEPLVTLYPGLFRTTVGASTLGLAGVSLMFGGSPLVIGLLTFIGGTALYPED